MESQNSALIYPWAPLGPLFWGNHTVGLFTEHKSMNNSNDNKLEVQKVFYHFKPVFLFFFFPPQFFHVALQVTISHKRI